MQTEDNDAIIYVFTTYRPYTDYLCVAMHAACMQCQSQAFGMHGHSMHGPLILTVKLLLCRSSRDMYCVPEPRFSGIVPVRLRGKQEKGVVIAQSRKKAKASSNRAAGSMMMVITGY